MTFEPGARTAWHTHPLGQTLIVTSGLGWVQREGGSIEEIRPGDVVWFAPGEKHWPGATPKPTESASPKYRRQSFYTSEACGNEHVVPWNKSFDLLSCAYIAGRCTAVQRALEALPNEASTVGTFEAVRAPYQREGADPVYGDGSVNRVDDYHCYQKVRYLIFQEYWQNASALGRK